MGDYNQELDLAVMDKFAEYVDAYTEACNIETIKFDDDIAEIMTANRETLKEMSANDLNAWAVRLISFAFYVQSELNNATTKRDWCNEVMNHLVAKHYDHEAFMKYEVRRKMCALEVNNTLGTRVEKIHTYMQARVTLLTDKVGDVRKMADTLNQMAKRKDYS